MEDLERIPDLDTLVTSLYVTVDDLLIEYGWWRRERPLVGIAPKLSDAELVTLAVIQALLGFTSEARFLRYAHTHLKSWFPYLPGRASYNKGLGRSTAMTQHVISWFARACPSWHDDLWMVRPQPPYHPPLRACGLGRIRLLRCPLSVIASPPGFGSVLFV